VTFLCTAYRTEHTIRETLDSVVGQTRDDWQMVVVDNGMSDEIAAIVEPYTADARIILVRQENQRAWGGVNAAARLAEGRYVVVLHTDDLVLPTFLERVVPIMDAGGTDALAPDAYYLGEGGLRRETYRERVPAQYRVGAPVTYRELIDGWVPFYVGPVRREAWEAVGGFRSDAAHIEDLALWLDLMARGYVVRCLEEPLTAYREDDGSDSRGAAGVEVMEQSWQRVMTAAIESHGSAEDKAALAARLVWSRHRESTVRARRLLLDGDYAAAREAAREARSHQADPRTRVMAAALTIAPGAVRSAYRTRKALQRRLQRLQGRTPVEAVTGQGSRG
jgi:hypothetical protein